MADIGLCKGCKKPKSGLTRQCRACEDKFCTTCYVKAGGKCPTCGKAASLRPNPDA